MLSSARPRLPCCIRRNVSQANVEKVLNPPQTPTVRKNHMAEDLPQASAPATEIQARSPVARTLAAKTAQGNDVPEGDKMDASPWPTAKRRTLPSPPPRNTASQVVSVGVMGRGRV